MLMCRCFTKIPEHILHSKGVTTLVAPNPSFWQMGLSRYRVPIGALQGLLAGRPSCLLIMVVNLQVMA